MVAPPEVGAAKEGVAAGDEYSGERTVLGLAREGGAATGKACVCFARFLQVALTNKQASTPRMCKVCGSGCGKECAAASPEEENSSVAGRGTEGEAAVEEQGNKVPDEDAFCGYCGSHYGKCRMKGTAGAKLRSCSYLGCEIDKKTEHLNSVHEQVSMKMRREVEGVYGPDVYHARVPVSGPSRSGGGWASGGGSGGSNRNQKAGSSRR